MNAGQSDHRWGRQKKYWNIVKTMREAIHAYGRDKLGYTIEAARTDTSEREPHTIHVALSHALWMCDQTDGFINDFLRRDAKVYRWVGFIQGILWMTDVMSIDDMRKLNDTEVT